MPIYEYYCPACDARFSHLAQRFGAPPPPCPGCGAHEAQKMVSLVNQGRSDAARRADLDARARDTDQDDPRELARLMQKAGSLGEDILPVDQELYREMVSRRAQGAQDEDLQDIVDAVSIPDHAPSRPHQCQHEHEHPPQKHSPRKARDLGWA